MPTTDSTQALELEDIQEDIKHRLAFAETHQHTPQLFPDYYLRDVSILLNRIAELEQKNIDASEVIDTYIDVR